MLYGYSTSRRTTQRVVEAFINGSNGTFVNIDQLRNGIPSDATAVVSFGILRGTADVYKQAERKGVDYFHIDHAYYMSGHPGPDPWYRVSKNGINFKKLQKQWPSDRFNLYFKNAISIKPWTVKDNGYILVLPPTQPTAWYTQSEKWLDQTVQEIRRNTDRPIRVRHKPPVMVCDDKGFPLPKHIIEEKIREMEPIVSKNSLQEDLENAYCVVAYNSGVVVDAIEQGIPVSCSDQAASYSMSFNLADINHAHILAQEPDRQNWFNALAYHQYKMSEMADGTAWNMIQEYYNEH